MFVRRELSSLLCSLALCVAACSDGARPPTSGTRAVDGSERVPLTDLGADTYLGFSGGLYPDGSNDVPDAHANAGLLAANSVQPLDGDGNPSPDGKYVLLSIGMSNTTQEFCSQGSGPPCDPWTLMGRAAADPQVNHATLVIANGARGGQTAMTWDSPDRPNYDIIRDTWLRSLGLTEKQVQIVWLKVADANPKISLSSEAADAFFLESEMGKIARALKSRYPNLRQVFVSSRIYGGYATTTLNPEPYAYESGFAVKWLIEAQIRQRDTGVIDDIAGDLDDATAPWIARGSYLWANGATPRSDGLAWYPEDFSIDGTHPSQSGRAKVGDMLLNFFEQSPYTTCWFLTDGSCPQCGLQSYFASW